MVARDPSGKTGNAVVTVTVTRDQPPVFVSTPYRTSVVENRQINSKIFTVAANDPDRKVGILYRPRDKQIKTNYFLVHKIVICA